MIRRVRFLSGVTLLTALSLSLVEGVAAAACSADASIPRAGATGAMATDMAAPDVDSDATGAMDHDCPPAHAGDESEQSDGAPSCPFVLPGAPGGCSYATSLPAVVAVLRPLARVGEHAAPSIERRPVFLKVSAIFRPPIA